MLYQETTKEHPNSHEKEQHTIILHNALDLTQNLHPHFIRAVYESITTGIIWITMNQQITKSPQIK